jgi:hypothetical protein
VTPELSTYAGHEEVLCVESSRGFLTITGQWRGHSVSIVTHLMGFGNLDLSLRETRAVTTGTLYVIRIGTCGSLNGTVGQMHVSSRGAVAILRDPDAFLPGSHKEPYRITEPLLPDGPLTAALLRELRAVLGDEGASRSRDHGHLHASIKLLDSSTMLPYQRFHGNSSVSIVAHLVALGNLHVELRVTTGPLEVTTGPLYVIRISTCGSLNGTVGQMHVPSGGAPAILRDPNAFVLGREEGLKQFSGTPMRLSWAERRGSGNSQGPQCVCPGLWPLGAQGP